MRIPNASNAVPCILCQGQPTILIGPPIKFESTYYCKNCLGNIQAPEHCAVPLAEWNENNTKSEIHYSGNIFHSDYGLQPQGLEMLKIMGNISRHVFKALRDSGVTLVTDDDIDALIFYLAESSCTRPEPELFEFNGKRTVIY